MRPLIFIILFLCFVVAVSAVTISKGNVTWEGYNLTGGNMIFGSIYNYSSTGETIDIVSSEVYVNLTNMSYDEDEINGFDLVDNKALQAQYSGLYKFDWSVSFSGGANDQYGLGVAKNFNIENSRECYSRMNTNAAGLVGNVGGSCVHRLDIGDTINLQVDDEADPVSDITIYTAHMNALRIGD